MQNIGLIFSEFHARIKNIANALVDLSIFVVKEDTLFLKYNCLKSCVTSPIWKTLLYQQENIAP